jgi:RHS repeat-associated protein
MTTTTSGSVYYHHDGLGSTVALTDAAGAKIESYTYDVFGTVSIFDAAGFPQSSSTAGNRFLFTGREWITELGLYDYRNRVYSAELGRFLQTDPIQFDAGDVNLYRYVFNNPINLVDPSGLLMEGPVGRALGRAAVGAAVGAVAGSAFAGVGAGPGAIIGAVAGLLLTTPSTAHAPTMMDQPRPFIDPQEWMGPLNSPQRRFRQDEDDCLKSLEKSEEMYSSPLSQQEKDDFMRNCMESKGHTYP